MIELKQLIGKNDKQIHELLKDSKWIIDCYSFTYFVIIYVDKEFIYTNSGRKYKIKTWYDLAYKKSNVNNI